MESKAENVQRETLAGMVRDALASGRLPTPSLSEHSGASGPGCPLCGRWFQSRDSVATYSAAGVPLAMHVSCHEPWANALAAALHR